MPTAVGNPFFLGPNERLESVLRVMRSAVVDTHRYHGSQSDGDHGDVPRYGNEIPEEKKHKQQDREKT